MVVAPGATPVTSVSPRYGPTAGGSSVTISGSGFQGTQAVWFGSEPAPFFSVQPDGDLLATVPPSVDATGVSVRVTMAGAAGTTSNDCTVLQAGCADAYFYMAALTPLSFSTDGLQTFYTSLSIGSESKDCLPSSSSSASGSGQGASMCATGGSSVTLSSNANVNLTLNTQGNLSADAGLPVAFTTTGQLDVTSATTSLALTGAVQGGVLIPLPLGLPQGLDLYLKVDGDLSGSFTMGVTVQNLSVTFANGFVNGQAFSSATTYCDGALLTAANISQCLVTQVAPAVAASLRVFPLWLQAGPAITGATLDLGVGVGVGLGVSASASGGLGWDACIDTRASAHVAIGSEQLSTGLNLLGPFNLVSSNSDHAASDCPFGPISPNLPGAPQAVSAVAANAQATVSWQPPSGAAGGDGGSPITAYTVTPSPSVPSGSVTVGGGTTQAVVTGLQNGTPYTFTVDATNAEGTGPASAASQAVTPEGGAAVGSVALRAVPNPVPSSSSGMASSVLTAQVEDGPGHALSGRSVTFQVLSGGCGIAGSPGTTNALGSATATLEQPAESLTADAVCQVTATSGGVGAPGLAVTFQGLAPVGSVALRAVPNPVPSSSSSGTASSVLTAQVEDGQGHALSGRSVTFQVLSGGCGITGSPSTTNALGNATATLQQPAESLTADAVCRVTATSGGVGAPYVLVTFQGVPSVRFDPPSALGCQVLLIPGAAYPPCQYSVTYTGTSPADVALSVRLAPTEGGAGALYTGSATGLQLELTDTYGNALQVSQVGGQRLRRLGPSDATSTGQVTDGWTDTFTLHFALPADVPPGLLGATQLVTLQVTASAGQSGSMTTASAVPATAAFSVTPVFGTVSVGTASAWAANTGMVVVAGQELTVSASGTVYIGAVPNYGNESPNGQPWSTCASANGGPSGVFVAPGLRCWSLIGKVGPNGTPFQLGDHTTFVAPATGNLYLGINDNYFPDNSGAWTVTVIGSPGSP